MQLNTIWVYLFTRPCHSSTQLVNRNKLNVGQLWRGVQQKYHYCSSEILFLCCQGNRATKKYLSYDWMNLIYCMINLSNLLVVDKDLIFLLTDRHTFGSLSGANFGKNLKIVAIHAYHVLYYLVSVTQTMTMSRAFRQWLGRKFTFKTPQLSL